MCPSPQWPDAWAMRRSARPPTSMPGSSGPPMPKQRTPWGKRSPESCMKGQAKPAGMCPEWTRSAFHGSARRVLEWSTFGQLLCKKQINAAKQCNTNIIVLSHNSERRKTTQIHEFEICNQQVAGSIPVTSSKNKTHTTVNF